VHEPSCPVGHPPFPREEKPFCDAAPLPRKGRVPLPGAGGFL